MFYKKKYICHRTYVYNSITIQPNLSDKKKTQTQIVKSKIEQKKNNPFESHFSIDQ